MRTWSRPTASILTAATAAALVAAAWLAACGGPDSVVPTVETPATPADRARQTLARAGEAYRSLPGFVETFQMTIRLPGSEPGQRTIRYGAWGAGNAFMTLGPYDFVLEGDRLVVTAERSTRHVVAPAVGGFSAALARIGATAAGIRVPATLVLREGRPVADAVDALRFEVFDALEPVGVEQRPERGMTEIRFEAPSGWAVLRLDDSSRLFREIELEAELLEGGEPVRMDGTFVQQTLGEGERAVAAPDLAGGVAVTTFEALELGEVRIGTTMPDLALRELSGDTLRLSDLRGRIVVLDLWATWCIPCRRTLLQADAVAAWAEQAGHPVTVYGVATQELADGFEAQRDRVAAFWRRGGYGFDTLVDPAGEVSPAIGDPGIPSSVVIAPDGTITAVHAGAARDLGDRLRRDVEALLR